LMTDYNIDDVDIVKSLDEKLNLLDLAMTVAYRANINFNDVYSPVKTWDSMVYNKLKKNGVVCPPRTHHEKNESFAGAYVKDPKIGFSDWVVSFDLNSMYPHLIMQYNMGIETIVNDVPDELADIHIGYKINEEGKKEINPDLLDKKIDLSALKKYNYSMAANGVFFDNNKEGILPAMMKDLYAMRKKDKKEMLKWESELEQALNSKAEPAFIKMCTNNIAKYNALQMAAKILMNSLYGASGNAGFRYFDLRVAEGITMSGQLAIRWAANNINAFLQNLLKDNKDRIIASDTDSCYLELADIVDKKFPKGISREQIIDAVDGFASKVMTPKIKEIYDDLKEYTNAKENAMVMEREVIAERGFWVAKKRYVLKVWNSEGVHYDNAKLKVLGLEAKRSSTPLVCRNALKKLYSEMIDGTQESCQKFIVEFEKEWNKMEPDQIGAASSCNGLTKYRDATHLYKSGTPMHVKGSIIHNHMCDKLNLKDVKKIGDGDKVKVIMLNMPNPSGSPVLSFVDKFPREFGLIEFVDYRGQFEKSFLSAAENTLKSVGWKAEDSGDLSSFFS